MKPKILLLAIVLFLESCAASYQLINPPGLNYLSNNSDKSVNFEYKYSLLPRKYAKKEEGNDIKLVAIKITNSSGHDLVFGRDAKLTFGNGNEAVLIDKGEVYNKLKQQSGFYLLYLLLTPMTLNVNSSNGTSSSTPIGYGVGPGLAGLNMIVASTANSNFKEELDKYEVIGTTIKNNTTIYGLVGIKTTNYEALKIKVN